MEYRQAFARGLPRFAEKIDEKSGSDRVAPAERVQGRLVERGQRHVAPGRNDRVGRIRAWVAVMDSGRLSKTLGQTLDFAFRIVRGKIGRIHVLEDRGRRIAAGVEDRQ
jgi:hypothetical protein